MKLTIQNAVEITTAKGVHAIYNNKPVLCIDTGELYVSLRDAALSNHIDPGALSRALSQRKPCKGLRFCFIDKTKESVETIAEAIRDISAKAQAYDAIKKRQDDIVAAEKAIEKHKANIEKYNRLLCEETAFLTEAEKKLSELKNND